MRFIRNLILLTIPFNCSAYCEINRLYSKDIKASECRKVGNIHLIMPCNSAIACWTDEKRIMDDNKDCDSKKRLPKETKEVLTRSKYRRC